MTTQDIYASRLTNLLYLHRSYAEKAVAGGAPAKGLDKAFASSVQISSSQFSQLRGGKQMGEKLARQIESLVGMPNGWMDQDHGFDAPITDTEQKFLDETLEVLRTTNQAGRRRLRGLLQELLAEAKTKGKSAA